MWQHRNVYDVARSSRWQRNNLSGTSGAMKAKALLRARSTFSSSSTRIIAACSHDDAAGPPDLTVVASLIVTENDQGVGGVGGVVGRVMRNRDLADNWLGSEYL